MERKNMSNMSTKLEYENDKNSVHALVTAHNKNKTHISMTFSQVTYLDENYNISTLDSVTFYPSKETLNAVITAFNRFYDAKEIKFDIVAGEKYYNANGEECDVTIYRIDVDDSDSIEVALNNHGVIMYISQKKHFPENSVYEVIQFLKMIRDCLDD